MTYHLFLESNIWHKGTYLQEKIMDMENRRAFAKREEEGEGVGWTGSLGLVDTNSSTITCGVDKQWDLAL